MIQLKELITSNTVYTLFNDKPPTNIIQSCVKTDFDYVCRDLVCATCPLWGNNFHTIYDYKTDTWLEKERKIEVPLKWVVKNPHNSQSQFLYDWFTYVSGKKEYTSGTYFHYPAFKPYKFTNSTIQSGYTSITIDFFIEHIFNKSILKSKEICIPDTKNILEIKENQLINSIQLIKSKK